MINLKALRDQRNAKATEARNLLDPAVTTFSADVSKQIDRIYEEIDLLDSQISALERQAKIDGDAQLDAQARENDDRRIHALSPEQREQETRYRAAFHTFIIHGLGGMERDDIIALRQGAIQNAQSGQPGNGGAGGYLVPTGFGGQLLEALKSFGGMRDVANVVQTDSGIAIPFPTVDETGQMGEIVAENQPASSQDVAFGTVSIGAYKFSSKVFTVPFELLQDQGPGMDIEAFIIRAASTRIWRIQNQLQTTGTGVNQPRGIVTAASVGVAAATGYTATIDPNSLIDLEHSVDPAYRKMPGVGYMFHDTTLRAIKKLKDGQGNFLWKPGFNSKDPDTLNSYRYTINQDMPVMAANAKSVLFGDLHEYMIRDVMNVTLFRFDDSVYTKLGQVGFLAWARGDGNLVTGGAPVKAYQQAAS